LLLLLWWSSILSAFVHPSGTSSSSLRVASWSQSDQLRMAAEDDEDNNPLSLGIDSVSWLPSVCGPGASRSAINVAEVEGGEVQGTTETLPLFPLGGIVYTPNSEHTLNIFEPRYRQMYNDILMNGSKRFAVSMCHPNEEGRFAQMGVLFSLEELKEVSEMTADRVKYICNHRVTGRVKLHKVLNPEAWENRETYLKVEGTIIDDTGKLVKSAGDDEKDTGKDQMDENISQNVVATLKKALKADAIEKTPNEDALARSFSVLVELQHDLSEDVRFTRASIKSFGVSKDNDVDPNLWSSIRLWQSYAEQRLVAGQNDMQKEFQERLVEYLKSSTRKQDGSSNTSAEEDLPSAIGFQDLSPELQAELIDLQKRMTAELKPLLLEQTLSMQKILEAANHDERVELMRYFVDAERKRLAAKKMLKSMFRGEAAAVSKEENKKSSTAGREIVEAPTAMAPPSVPRPTLSAEGDANEPQFFADDEDAFQ